MERLQKVMAHAGIASRRKSEEIISQGRVEVNGEVVTEMGIKVNPDRDCIKVDNEIIHQEDKIYILLNKPEGYITTVDDPRGRKTILDLIENISQRIYPVGRLDYDSSGLLLLTNDGELTYVLTHPSFEINKTYLVEVKGVVTKKDLKKLEKGINLEDGVTAPAKVKFLNQTNNRTSFEITIHEGRNRQVRRMCQAINHQVLSLKRIAYSFLSLNNLKKGDYRFLTDTEIKKMHALKKQ